MARVMNGGKRLRPTLGLVTMVKNEEDTLSRCLSSLAGILDQVVIVDTGSTDGTKELIETFGAKATADGELELGCKLVDFEWCDDFSAPRNAGLELCTTDWVIHLDADEELVSGADLLPDLLRDKYIYAYYVSMAVAPSAQAALGGAETFPAIRLFRRRLELVYKYPIHEQIVVADPGRTALSGVMINHFGPSIGRGGESKAGRNIPILEKAIEREPEDGYFYATLANEYFNQQRYSEALPYYQQSIELEGMSKSWSSAAVRNLAWCLIDGRQFDVAFSMLAEGQAQCPDYTDLYYIEAHCAIETGDLRRAERLLKKCLQLGDSPLHYITLGGTGSWRAQRDLERLAAI